MARHLKAIQELNWTSREDRDVREVLTAWAEARRERAEAEMPAIARDLGERRFLQSPDGFGGELQMNVHAESFHYWGQRLGYECWSDPVFCREYARDNPAARVKNHPRTLQLIVPGEGGLAASGQRKFWKRY